MFLILFGVFVEYDWTVDTRFDKTGLWNPQDDAKQPDMDGKDGPGNTHQELYGSKYSSFMPKDTFTLYDCDCDYSYCNRTQ